MTYGEIIKQSREKLCRTQEQLAEALGVSRQAVSKWEANLSRPTRAKLERLSELLEIPMETWAAIDAEQAAANQPPDRTRPWKITAGILAAACVIMGIALSVLLWRQAHPGAPASGAANSGQAQISEKPAPPLPETLPLKVRNDFDYGDVPLGEYEPSLIPYLNDPAEVLEQALWEDSFSDGVRICLAASEAYRMEEQPRYSLYLLYQRPGESWQILYRIEEDLKDPWDSQPTAEAFSNLSGRAGFKLTLYNPAWEGWSSTYLSQRPDGTPCMTATLICEGQEADVDEDGELEIVWFDPYLPAWELFDTAEGEEGAFIYTLPCDTEGRTEEGVRFTPERGGFTAADAQNTVLARYVLQDGRLVRRPLTDFTAMDWPDVTGTNLIFITDDGYGLSDGLDPDEALYRGTARITHRQQAYLALQELYDLTGLKVEECYCSASEYSILFSLLPDGFNQRSFFCMDFPEQYGGGGSIPQFRIAWRELGNDWSPLSLERADRPEETGEHLLQGYYNRLKILRIGEAVRETAGEFPEERNLYLENGDAFVGFFQDTPWGPALVSLIGPYPGGDVRH